MTVMSIDRGPTDAELIDETIGVNLRRTAQRLPDHEAFVVAHQGIRQTWSEFDATVDAVAKGLMAIGIEVGEIALKDVILPGEMRAILNQVVEAQKEAEANVIRRREETNATRSLLNTARLMENNPLLLRMKELETLEKLTEKVGRLDVSTSAPGHGLDALLSNLVRLSNQDAQASDD